MVAVAESDPRIGITGPTMLYADPADVLWGGDNVVDLKQSKILRKQMGEKLDLAALRQAKAAQTGYIDSCAILVRRVVFERAGLMDGRFFINFDDVDLNLRARRAGYTIFYVPAAIMWHRVSAAMGVGSPATTYYMTRNALLFFTRHAPGPWKAWGLARILFQTARTVAAWKLRPAYREAIFRRKAAANLYAVRDFFLGRFGRMGADVARACSAK
jgi:GT2 family glycosyltransferase